MAVQAAQKALSQVTFQVDRVYASGQFFNEYLRFLTTAQGFLPARTDGLPVPDGLTEVAVQAVTLRFPGRDRPAVDGVTFTIKAGQTVALVGENGSGKTTLAAMIAGLRQPTDGRITWNGRPLAEWDGAGVRRHIAVVRQDFHKWSLSVATNIAMGDIGSGENPERIEAAAVRAAAHDMIQELGGGYGTLLNKTFRGGEDLSGGQWQRITAARGFYRDAPLLIMDEPSSALDPVAEDTLFQALRDRQGNKATILITHRLANITHADQIIVLDRGAVVETGTHAELMAAGGVYQRLFTLQAAGYASEPTAAVSDAGAA